MVKYRLINTVFTAVLVGSLLFIGGCSRLGVKQEGRALFSWKAFEVLEGRMELFETMKAHKLNTLYQVFSSKLEEDDIISFLEEAAEDNINVYFLEGSPEWALEEEVESMCLSVDRALEINGQAGEAKGVKGILFDVEPYLLEEWEERGPKEVMNSFVKGMKTAYQKAHEGGLEVIVCIPYFYENLGVSEQMEALIKSCSDSVAVMNYYQEKEIEHLKTEAELSDRYGKKLINIYELQAPGEHGLKDDNTYYEEGMEGVEENFASLRKTFSGQNISIAIHEYKALLEVTGRE